MLMHIPGSLIYIQGFKGIMENIMELPLYVGVV